MEDYEIYSRYENFHNEPEPEYEATAESGFDLNDVVIHRAGHFSVIGESGLYAKGARSLAKWYNENPDAMAQTWKRIDERNERERKRVFGKMGKKVLNDAVSI